MGDGTDIIRFSTSSFASNKVSRWGDILSQVNWPVDYSGMDPDSFEAELEVASIGPAFLCSHWTQPAIAERREAHLASSTRQFQLVYHTQGRMQFRHYGRTDTYDTGAVLLSDNGEPGRMHYETPISTLILRLPPELLRCRIAFPERVCNVALSNGPGFSGALRELLVSLWTMRKQGVPEDVVMQGLGPLLDLLAASCAIAWRADVSQSAVGSAWLVRIKRHVEANLADPDLSPSSVAAACRLSDRYLRKIFACEEESLGQYIRRRRLEACAEQIRSRLWGGHTLTELAHQWGFSSSAHFTRAFKGQFGMTPSEYRALPASELRRMTLPQPPATARRSPTELALRDRIDAIPPLPS